MGIQFCDSSFYIISANFYITCQSNHIPLKNSRFSLNVHFIMNEKSLEKLRKKNKLLQKKVWDDYRKYSTDLRIIKNQNKSLENSIKIEQNKNRELIQHFSNRIARMQEQIRQASYVTNNSPIHITKHSKSQKQKKNLEKNFEWRFLELEEEGKALQLETEKVFKKCRESPTAYYWRNEIPPPVTNYACEFAPIIINRPETDNFQGYNNYYNSDSDDSGLIEGNPEENDNSMSDVLHASPITSGFTKSKPKNYEDKSKDKKKSNYINSNSSYDSDDSVPMINNQKSSNNELFDDNRFIIKKKPNYNQNDEIKHIKHYDVSSDDDVIKYNIDDENSIPYPNTQANLNQMNQNNKNNQQNNQSNIQQFNPPKVQQNIQPNTQTQNNPGPNQQQQKPRTTFPENKPTEPQPTQQSIINQMFVSQSNWVDDSEDYQIEIMPEEIQDVINADDDNNKTSATNPIKDSSGIPSDTNPIIDSTSQQRLPSSLTPQNPNKPKIEQPPKLDVSFKKDDDTEKMEKKQSPTGPSSVSIDMGNLEFSFHDIGSINDNDMW
ncbi:hypothetical protein TRFO_19725 [Tritrichomonas foetus]|uniref:Uncharacterized protein n=1 Tax=Tritrichomonas foetus TaxID=1144522 RepID=A0A1J4KHF3_9EUKA|nr:hypothetical protein TRFO_19725 [Tritrichomonas foetus]|eukprot:OHT10839.1 hypothetical protein TRFO_19725 [Tritrichomonas foetus]